MPAFPFHDAAAGTQDGLLMTPKGSPDNVTSATGPLRRPSHPPAAFNFSRKREMTLGRYFGETRKSDSRSSWRRRCDGCYRADPPGRGEAVSAGRSISQRVCPNQNTRTRRCGLRTDVCGQFTNRAGSDKTSRRRPQAAGKGYVPPTPAFRPGSRHLGWTSANVLAEPPVGRWVDRRPSGSLALDGMPSCLRSDRFQVSEPTLPAKQPRRGRWELEMEMAISAGVTADDRCYAAVDCSTLVPGVCLFGQVPFHGWSESRLGNP